MREGMGFLESKGLKTYAGTIGTSLEKARQEFDDFFKQFAKDKLDNSQRFLVESLGEQYRPIFDHGILSACHLYAKLEALDRERGYVGKYVDSVWAIARHEMPLRSFRPDDDPLFFLLFLCDKVQEWGRPRVDRAQIAHKVLDSLRGSGDSDFGWVRTVQFVQVNLSCHMKRRGSKWLPSYRTSGYNPRRLVFRLKHNLPRKSGAEPPPGWIKLLFEFAKIGKSDHLPKIIIESWHPVEPDDGEPKEIDRLYLFANSPQGAYAAPSVGLIRRIPVNPGDSAIYCFDPEMPVTYAEDQTNRSGSKWIQLNFVLDEMYSIDPGNLILHLPDNYYSALELWKEKLKQGEDQKYACRLKTLSARLI
jgi:hypothetical protein